VALVLHLTPMYNMQLYLYTSATFPGFATKWFTIPSIKRNGIVETTWIY